MENLKVTRFDPSMQMTENGFWKGMDLRGPFRVIEYKGKKGLNATSVHSVAVLKKFKHTLGLKKGSLTVWVFPLEDMTQTISKGNFAKFEPNFFRHVILSDMPNMRDFESGSFLFMYQRFWKNALLAKFCSGVPHDSHGNRAIIFTESFTMKRNKWYQFGLSWDREKEEFRMYVNGIRISTENPWLENRSETVENPLCFGNPAFAIGELASYDKVLSEKDFQLLYEKEECGTAESDVNNEIRRVLAADNIPEFKWQPDERWKLELDVPFTKQEDLEHFYVQGCREAVSITEEGLYVETPRNEATNAPNAPDRESQVYLHTWKMFEGDMAVEFEFKYFGETGLALLMLQASGMQGEDFMKDYPLRTTGNMNMVHQENVRNYHWEFFRLMDGLPSYHASHLLVKNPWLYPIAYQIRKGQLEPEVWHHLQFVQEGDRLYGAVDGLLAFDVVDNIFDQHGASYHRGHLSLRNMFKTKFLWKNLKVYIKPPVYKTTIISSSTYKNK